MKAGALKKAELYEELKRRIEDRRFKPGEFLSELRLAREFCTSRMPVRQALAQLATEGFVKVHPNIGTQVCTPDWDDVRQILSHRAIIEEFCACQLAREREISINPAREKNEQMREISSRYGARQQPSETDRTRFVEHDVEFHSMLAELAQYPRLATELRDLRQRLHRVAYANLCGPGDRMEKVVQEHEAILDAIRPVSSARGVIPLVRQRLREHLDASRRRWKIPQFVEHDLPSIYEHEPPEDLAAEAEKFHAVRLQIEDIIVRELASNIQIDVSPAWELHEELKDVAEKLGAKPIIESDPRCVSKFINLDLAFHCTLAILSQYLFLEEALHGIWTRTYYFAEKGLRSNCSPGTVLKEHAAILESIRPAGDGQADVQKASERMREHLTNAYRRNSDALGDDLGEAKRRNEVVSATIEDMSTSDTKASSVGRRRGQSANGS